MQLCGSHHLERDRRRQLLFGAAGVSTGIVFLTLLKLATNRRDESGGSWVTAPRDRLGQYRSAIADFGGELRYEAARLPAWDPALVLWPLIALVLLWLAQRHLWVYLRTALALLLSTAAGMAVVITDRVLRPQPPDHTLAAGVIGQSHATVRPWQAGLFPDSFNQPGLQASWYLLTALAVISVIHRVLVRALLFVPAVSVVAGVVLMSDEPVTTASLITIVPAVAWYAAGRCPVRGREHRPHQRSGAR
ncbi:hypothetical protein AB0F77_41905 [Streptomyces sp. NPDC026672]|uniref:hypothetical protein n=1 Tax=unclassified Streptomyces TaxID=2593676 RepID=UPI0033F4DDB4